MAKGTLEELLQRLWNDYASINTQARGIFHFFTS